MYQCPNCASNIKFSIEKQQMYCEFCDTTINPYELKEIHQLSEYTDNDNDMQVTVYICSQCGGEIIGDENEVATFCSYCGASSIMNSRIDKAKKPKSIIPFCITKQDCEKSYKRLLNKAVFAPSYVKNPEKVNDFRGIYMPYWLYDFEYSGPVQYKGTHSYQKGDYKYTQHYQVSTEVNMKYTGVEFDASSVFSDSLSYSIAPFDAKERNPFTTAYFSGFYADAKDVESGVYESEAQNVISYHAYEKIKHTQKNHKYTIDSSSLTSKLAVEPTNKELTMLPVWFMSQRTKDASGKDRILYSIVNGQTGKCAADLPVSLGKYAIGSLLLAIPFFILYNQFLTLTPMTLLGIALALLIFCKCYLLTRSYKIAVKETKQDDKGHLFGKREISQNSKNRKRNPYKMPEPNKEIVEPVQKEILAEVSSKSNVLFYLSIITAILLFFIKPVKDFYYYGGVILTGICDCMMLVSFVKLHNKMTTRPLPQFNRQKASSILLLLTLALFTKSTALADTLYFQNEATGYQVYVDDRAELLTATETEKLIQDMKKITEYGNVSFVTTNHNPDSIDTYMREYYHNKFGSTSGTIFYIDMDNRKVGIFSDGLIYGSITTNKANTITDNVYEYATDGDYYKCAKTAFSQIYDVLEGRKIAEPMKYIGNALLALLTAMIFHYFIVIRLSTARSASEMAMADAAIEYITSTKPDAVAGSLTKVYSPRSSGSGSSGGGGGGSSGGGGSHSF